MLRKIRDFWASLTLPPEAVLLLGFVTLGLLILLSGFFLLELRMSGSDARSNALSDRLRKSEDRVTALELKLSDVWDGPRRRAFLDRLRAQNPTLIVPDPDRP